MAVLGPVFASSAEFDFLTFAAIENTHSDKHWCEENYPAFTSKNEIAFGKSIFSQMTGEEFIQSNATGDLRKKLLAALPQIRVDRQEEYARMPPKLLEQMCAFFELSLGRENMKEQQHPDASK